MPAVAVKIVIEETRALAREILQKANFPAQLIEARYGKQAIALTRKFAPDLVIIDMDAPGASEAVTQISSEHLAPMLLLTSFTKPLASFREKSGVLACLNKSVDERSFLATAQIALSRWREMKALAEELSELKEALATRKLTDRAKGILMERYHISEEESYRRIQKYAMKKRLTVKKVAEAIITAKSKSTNSC